MKRKDLTVLVVTLAALLPMAFGRSTGASSGPATATPLPTVSRPRVLADTPVPLGTPATSSRPAPPPPPPTPATPAAGATPTLLDLQNAIRQRTFDPAARRGRVGIKIVSLTSGKVIFEQDP